VKRSEALIPLSHDHQHGLDAALRLRRASADSASEAAAHFEQFWTGEGRHHFEIEERVLLGALPDSTPGWSDLTGRVRREHEDIRERAAAVADGGRDVSALRQLGDRLHDHIRFEERELFLILEASLSDAELSRLGAAIAQAHG